MEAAMALHLRTAWACSVLAMGIGCWMARSTCRLAALQPASTTSHMGATGATSSSRITAWAAAWAITAWMTQTLSSAQHLYRGLHHRQHLLPVVLQGTVAVLRPGLCRRP